MQQEDCDWRIICILSWECHASASCCHLVIVLAAVQVITAGPDPQICDQRDQLMLSIVQSCYKLSSSVTECGKAKILREINIMFEKHFTDDKVMMVSSSDLTEDACEGVSWPIWNAQVCGFLSRSPASDEAEWRLANFSVNVQAHAALMRRSFLSANVWDKYEASLQPAESPECAHHTLDPGIQIAVALGLSQPTSCVSLE
jgi:hypothetical protein